MSSLAVLDTYKEKTPDAPMDEDIPVASATALAPAAASSAATGSGSSFTFDLPIGSDGFQLTGVPVQLGETLDKDVVLPAGVTPGMYVHSIQILPDLEVTHLTNADTANQILKSNAHLNRRLVVRQDPPVLQHNDGFYYTHTLPTPATLEDLQIKMNGFPPRVVSVEDKSPFAGKIHPRQVVAELRIPGKPILNAQSPGFTAYKVEQDLKAATTISGIQLTVKDELKTIKNEKGGSQAVVCEDCVIL